jgi:dephospho-CoA kinase
MPLTAWLTLARLGVMKVIGLTGGIGSGKSTVARFLKELGAVVINADEVGHEAFKPNTDVWRRVVAAFGKEIIKPSGEIDRKGLGKIAFSNPEALARLNRLVHPYVYTRIKARLEGYRRRGVRVVVLEAPLLIEVPLSKKVGEPTLSDEVDEVWVTVAPESVVLQRLKDKSGMAEEQALARIRSQLSSAERVRNADVVINTDCSLDELKARVKELWPKLDT